jgi:NAD(P)-dependent dehydrogenase (short-subunit alcohol dehydrogenase family)
MPNRTAVVLESQQNKGVGLAISRMLARDGYKCLSGIDEEELENTHDRVDPDVRSQIEQVDISLDDRSSIITSVGEIAAEYGAIELLVINANTEIRRSLSEIEPNDWSRVIHENLLGPFYAMQELVPHMKSSRNRRIILVLPGRSPEKDAGDELLSAASKGALNGIINSLSRQIYPQISLNAVLPGHVIEGADETTVRTREQTNDPYKRRLKPQDVAEAVHYLARRTNKVTGQVLSLDSNRELP